ncbi:hypothetical protein T07_8742 [Trichinella nelsoni]|uniref:Uncharacterized protein n=1 Tax=Trichinella nelsoni TaxID=6336 RepID=A0A0V0RW11_9BILA|nr:hypothetical protein T07_8742 [Trichinella nelsoni]
MFTYTTKSIAHEILQFSRNTLESKMELMIINRSKTIRKVQQTYTGGSRLRLSRDMLKKVRTKPIIPQLLDRYCPNSAYHYNLSMQMPNKQAAVQWNCPNDAISVILRGGGPNVTRMATEKPPNVKGMKAAQEAAQQQLTNDPQGGL